MLKRLFQDLLYRLVHPFMGLLLRSNIHPNALTILGLLCNVWALWVWASAADGSWSSAYHGLWQGAVWVLAGGLFDILDGRLARLSGQESSAGALFDSVLDRYAEILMFAGLGWLAWHLDRPGAVLASYAAATMSLMVSYARARLEGLGANGTVGLFQRPERIILVSLGAIVCAIAGNGHWWASPEMAWTFIMEPILWLTAIGAGFTSLQRLVEGYRILQRR